MRKLILGCGYVGRRVARQWRNSGAEVHVVTRSETRAVQLAAEGFHPLVADVTSPDRFPTLPPCETVLHAIGFDRQAGTSMESVYVDGLRSTLENIKIPPERLIYISSTGVYGDPASWSERLDRDGDSGIELEAEGWMDESSPCYPTREGGMICLKAEKLLRAHPLAGRATILRLAGIYGPDRIPRREQFFSGQGLAVPLEGYLNLIHVDDAVRVILAAEVSERAVGTTYVVSDGHPVVRAEYYAELARCFGAPPPIITAPPSGAGSRRGTASGKRLRNTKMLTELGVELAYPSYREGLATIAAQASA